MFFWIRLLRFHRCIHCILKILLAHPFDLWRWMYRFCMSQQTNWILIPHFHTSQSPVRQLISTYAVVLHVHERVRSHTLHAVYRFEEKHAVWLNVLTKFGSHDSLLAKVNRQRFLALRVISTCPGCHKINLWLMLHLKTSCLLSIVHKSRLVYSDISERNVSAALHMPTFYRLHKSRVFSIDGAPDWPSWLKSITCADVLLRKPF